MRKDGEVGMSWRDDPITEKQRKLIMEIYDFCDWPLPAFTGTTKGEASDFIDKWIGKAHETILSSYEATHSAR